MQVGVHLLLFLVQILFASLAIVGKIVLRDFPAGSIVLFRVVGAAGVLLLVNLIWTRRWVRDRRDLLGLAVLGLLGVVLNQTLFLLGLSHTTAINATILVTTIPVFTVLYSVVSKREPPSALKFGGIAVAGAGAVYLIGPDRLSLAPDLALGNLLIVVAMFCYSLYLVHSKAMVLKYGPVTVSAYVMMFSAIGTLPLSASPASRPSTSPPYDRSPGCGSSTWSCFRRSWRTSSISGRWRRSPQPRGGVHLPAAAVYRRGGSRRSDRRAGHHPGRNRRCGDLPRARAGDSG